MIYLLTLIWVSDSAAYFVGRALGRHRMSPRISPGKTWEGAAASVILGVAFGIAYMRFCRPDSSVGWSALIALVVNLAGQIGDLAESALKRSAAVKDSSAILPGHGGFLDRLDALLFAVPALWYILVLPSVAFSYAGWR
jgi:phosphatidate cytidylyltransferase